MDQGKSPVFSPEDSILPVNRAALESARPWAWRRLLDGVPAAPRPESVIRPGWPFNLQVMVEGRPRMLHAPADPAAEAQIVVSRFPVDTAAAIVVVGFGAGYLVEAALSAAPGGCTVVAAVVDPGALLATLGGRDVSGLLSDPRLVLGIGDAAELRAALPRTARRVVWIVHPPVLAAAAPELASFAAARPQGSGSGAAGRTGGRPTEEW